MSAAPATPVNGGQYLALVMLAAIVGGIDSVVDGLRRRSNIPFMILGPLIYSSGYGRYPCHPPDPTTTDWLLAYSILIEGEDAETPTPTLQLNRKFLKNIANWDRLIYFAQKIIWANFLAFTKLRRDVAPYVVGYIVFIAAFWALLRRNDRKRIRRLIYRRIYCEMWFCIIVIGHIISFTVWTVSPVYRTFKHIRWLQKNVDRPYSVMWPHIVQMVRAPMRYLRVRFRNPFVEWTMVLHMTLYSVTGMLYKTSRLPINHSFTECAALIWTVHVIGRTLNFIETEEIVADGSDIFMVAFCAALCLGDCGEGGPVGPPPKMLLMIMYFATQCIVVLRAVAMGYSSHRRTNSRAGRSGSTPSSFDSNSPPLARHVETECSNMICSHKASRSNSLDEYLADRRLGLN